MSVDYEVFGNQLYAYCNKYKIPPEMVFKVLEDQKVVPMIRGKATEYSVYVMLKAMLDDFEWSVLKLNLNAQPNSEDEDISITHQRTGIVVKVECKNACRGSFKYSRRCKIKVPHCKIKCHKSRSSLDKATTTNDKYPVDAFDIIISNLSNSVIAGATYSENFELIQNEACLQLLSSHYNVPNTFDDLFNATFNDWRFAKTPDLAVDGFLPRTPPLLLNGDEIWKPISELENTLLHIIREKRNK